MGRAPLGGSYATRENLPSSHAWNLFFMTSYSSCWWVCAAIHQGSVPHLSSSPYLYMRLIGARIWQDGRPPPFLTQNSSTPPQYCHTELSNEERTFPLVTGFFFFLFFLRRVVIFVLQQISCFRSLKGLFSFFPVECKRDFRLGMFLMLSSNTGFAD